MVGFWVNKICFAYLGLLVSARKRPDRHFQDEPRGLGPKPVGGPIHSRQVASNRFTLSIPGRVAEFRSGLTPGTAGLCWLIKMDLQFTLTESPSLSLDMILTIEFT
ncbi:unnamed protein product [Prunus armeniaca]